MNVRKYGCSIVIAIVALYACNNDDDNNTGGGSIEPPRDRAEQQVEDDKILQDYLNTHFYTFQDVYINGDDIPEYRIVVFDTIAGDNSDQQSIMQSGLVTTRKANFQDVEYNFYTLELNKGGTDYAAKVSDSVSLTYRGELLYDNNDDGNKIFDQTINPTTLDLTATINGAFGFALALEGFSGATDLFLNDDGTTTLSDDYGDLVVFLPSGLGYFNQPQTGIPAYSPLIFNMQIHSVKQADHDQDGIPSYLEDLDNDKNVLDADDNTDGDNAANYQDSDDDNDGTLTRDEITLVAGAKDDGVVTLDEITFYDDDGDGIPNHLDPDDRDPKNEL